MGVAHQIQSSTSKVTTDLTASLKPEEAEADPGVNAAGKTETPQPPGANAPNPAAVEPIKATDGVIRVQAAAFVKTGGEISWAGQSPQVLLHDSFTGGKQVYFQQQMKSQWADYLIDVPVVGVYEITMQAAVVNARTGLFEVVSDGCVIATVPIPLSYGLWVETRPVELHLNQGMQTLHANVGSGAQAGHYAEVIRNFGEEVTAACQICTRAICVLSTAATPTLATSECGGDLHRP